MKIVSSRISNRTLQNFERAIGFVGFGILCWMIFRLGPARVVTHLHKVGWGFFLMVFFKGIRYFVQTAAWKLILFQESEKIRFWKLFRIVLEGESLNYITVTRMGGEPFKVIAINEKVSLQRSAASVIVLKFCTIFGFWLTITCGFLLVLLHAGVDGGIKWKIGLGLVGLTTFVILISWVQRRGTFRFLSWILKQFRSKREWISKQVLKLTRLDNEILETYRSRPGRIIVSILLSAAGWIEDIFFIWLALYFLHIQENWFLPTLIGTLSLGMNSFFFFVPWRAGTQEGTMVLSFTLLALSEPMGLSLAILKRMRELIWIFAGLTSFALRSLKN